MATQENIIEEQILSELRRIGGLIDSPNRIIERLIQFWHQNHQVAVPSHPARGVRQSVFDPFSPPSLRHTKLTGAVLNGEDVKGATWNGLVDEIIRLAHKRCGSFSDLKKVVQANMMNGLKTDQGYRYLADLGLSVQGLDAQDAWRCIAHVARALNIKVEIYFFWRDNPGAYLPGQSATLCVPGR